MAMLLTSSFQTVGSANPRGEACLVSKECDINLKTTYQNQFIKIKWPNIELQTNYKPKKGDFQFFFWLILIFRFK